MSELHQHHLGSPGPRYIIGCHQHIDDSWPQTDGWPHPTVSCNVKQKDREWSPASSPVKNNWNQPQRKENHCRIMPPSPKCWRWPNRMPWLTVLKAIEKLRNTKMCTPSLSCLCYWLSTSMINAVSIWSPGSCSNDIQIFPLTCFRYVLLAESPNVGSRYWYWWCKKLEQVDECIYLDRLLTKPGELNTENLKIAGRKVMWA